METLSEEDKSCFFLRCLFQEDYDIPIEYLVRYEAGRRLFPKIDKVAEARNRVHALVENLKKSSLLLLSEKEECVKMPDVRASALKNATLSYFTISKRYFINYTIPFYNTPYIKKLYYFTFSLKYYFFNLSLLFLSHHHFFSVKGWNKIYIYIFFSIVLQYNSKLRNVL